MSGWIELAEEVTPQGNNGGNSVEQEGSVVVRKDDGCDAVSVAQ